MKNSKKYVIVIIILIIAFLIYFFYLPNNKNTVKKKILKKEQKVKTIEKKDVHPDKEVINSVKDTPKQVIVNRTKSDNKEIIVDNSKNIIVKENNIEEIKTDIIPNMARSIFHDYWVSYFAGVYKDKKINIDEGKKIVCLFDTKNNYNIEVATSVSNLLKNKEIPSVFTIFGGCGSDAVFAFYKKAGCNFPSTETDLKGFNEYLGTYKCPAVFYLWNGNIIKVYEGEGINKFNAEDLKKVCNAKYVPKKRNASK